jgi:hypothetical protein
MSIQDDRFAAAKDHETAMTVRAMMSAITDLCELAKDDIGYDLIQSNIDDVELSHARLGQLLDNLQSTKRAAQ